jgi:glycosyltransferase involved in cell wall biosynthesis
MRIARESGESHGSRSAPFRIAPHPQPGINLVGFLDAESGLGEIARRLAEAVRTSDVPLSAISYRGTKRRQHHSHGLALGDEAPYDTNVVCLNPGHLPGFVADVGADFFARRYGIGVWFWETDRFRAAERSAVRHFDELWVASDYVRDAIAGAVDVPVVSMPVPMEPPTGPFRTRAELDLPERFTFLFVFDFWSEERKNPVAVVEAFTRAFSPGEGPTLVVKSIHGDSKAKKLEKLRAVAADRSDVVVRDGYVSALERDSYLAACDCYVSLHRSEGLGLTMAEAMALGKPVIATGYSGNLEFMDEANSYLVPYDVVDVPASWWGHAPGATWAEPDVDAAARLMRRAWEHPDEAGALGERARGALRERFSTGRTVEVVERRLEEIRTRGAIAARASAHDARVAIVEASQALERDIGASLADASRRTPISLLRRLLHRALWPYLEDQRRLETSVLDAVTSLQRSVQDLEQRLLRLEGQGSQGETDEATAHSRRP